MTNPVNPQHITIRHDGKDKDGNPLGSGDGLTFQGFEVQVNSAAFLSLPSALNPNGVYEASIADQVEALPNGTNYQLRARTVCTAVGGVNMYSTYTQADASFDVNLVRSEPSAPLSVSLS